MVAIHDRGVSAGGGPWYTMRRIRGRSLDAAIREAPDLDARLRLLRPFLQACEAVAHAHGRGVIHRDLKPANVMLGEHGETLVVDWGLARHAHDTPEPSVDPSDGDLLPGGAGGALTGAGAVMGTPGWMSPEQARGEPSDERADVWSLGATLRFLIDGCPPVESAAWAPDVPAELAAIVDRATARAPADRYADASALAADVARYLDGRRVSAHRYSPADVLRRFVRVWRVPLAVAAASLVVLAATVAGFVQRVVAEGHRADANLSRVLAQSAVAAARVGARPEAELLAAEALVRGDAPRARGVLASFGMESAPVLASRHPGPRCESVVLSPRGDALLCLSGADVALWEPPEALAPRWTMPLAAREAVFLEAAPRVVVGGHHGADLALLDRATGTTMAVIPEFHRRALRGGQTTFGIGIGDHLAVWDAEGRPRHREASCANGQDVAAGAVSGKDEVAVLCPGAAPDSLDVRVLAPDGAVLRPAFQVRLSDRQVRPHLAAFDPAGRRLVCANSAGDLSLLDLGAGRLVAQASVPVGHVRALVWGTGGVLVVGDEGGPLVWDPERQAVAVHLPRSPRAGVGMAPSGEVVVVDGEVRRWRLPDDRRARVLDACPGGGVTSAVPSPDATEVVATCGDGSIPWLGLDGLVRREHAWEGVIKGAAFSPDGRLLVAVSAVSSDALVLDTRDASLVARVPIARSRRVVVFATGTVAAVEYGRSPAVFSLQSGAARVPDDAGWFYDIGLDPDARHAVLVGGPDHVGLQRLQADGRLGARLPISGSVVAAAIGRGGTTIAVALRQQLRLLDGSDGRERRRWSVDVDLLDVALSPDGALVAAAATDGTARVFDSATGVSVAILPGHTARVTSVAFSPDGAWLATASWDDTIRVWATAPLTEPAADLAAAAHARWALDLEDVIEAPGGAR